MGSITNASFEEPGINPGQADSWTESYSAGSEVIADFQYDDGYTRPFEDFASFWWYNHNYQLLFAITDLVSAFWSGFGSQHEDFESGWKAPVTPSTPPFNETSLFVFSVDTFSVATFSDADELDDFEDNWGNSPYNQTWVSDGADAGLTTGLFDYHGGVGLMESVEDFEEHWKDNEDYDSDGFAMNGAEPGLVGCLFSGYTYEAFDGSSWTTTFP